MALIKEAVETLCKPEHLQLRDWSLDLELLLDGQGMRHASAAEAGLRLFWGFSFSYGEVGKYGKIYLNYI